MRRSVNRTDRRLASTISPQCRFPSNDHGSDSRASAVALTRSWDRLVNTPARSFANHGSRGELQALKEWLGQALPTLNHVWFQWAFLQSVPDLRQQHGYGCGGPPTSLGTDAVVRSYLPIGPGAEANRARPMRKGTVWLRWYGSPTLDSNWRILPRERQRKFHSSSEVAKFVMERLKENERRTARLIVEGERPLDFDVIKRIYNDTQR